MVKVSSKSTNSLLRDWDQLMATSNYLEKIQLLTNLLRKHFEHEKVRKWNINMHVCEGGCSGYQRRRTYDRRFVIKTEHFRTLRNQKMIDDSWIFLLIFNADLLKLKLKSDKPGLMFQNLRQNISRYPPFFPFDIRSLDFEIPFCYTPGYVLLLYSSWYVEELNGKQPDPLCPPRRRWAVHAWWRSAADGPPPPSS